MAKMPQQERDAAWQEAKLLGKLHHPNVVRSYEHFQRNGKLCILMDYCAKGDLEQRLKAQRGQLLPESTVLDWFTQICLGVKHIHDRKVLHRDLKTSNCFICSDGTLKVRFVVFIVFRFPPAHMFKPLLFLCMHRLATWAFPKCLTAHSSLHTLPLGAFFLVSVLNVEIPSYSMLERLMFLSIVLTPICRTVRFHCDSVQYHLGRAVARSTALDMTRIHWQFATKMS